MPTYILLSTLTPEGRQTLHRNPERLEEVNKEITEFGCKVVAQYAVLGPYDFVSIISGFTNLHSFVRSDMGCWVHEQNNPLPHRPDR